MLTRGAEYSLSRIRVSAPCFFLGCAADGDCCRFPMSAMAAMVRSHSWWHGQRCKFAGASWTCLIEAKMVALYGAVAVAKSAGGGAWSYDGGENDASAVERAWFRWCADVSAAAMRICSKVVL